ncbi:hypothetical protein CSB69_2617 [Morganella morganii]|nr:hypothetical protein CSB69_2617 [Morganella morganii]EMP52444.1 hypothetical protein C790_03807 [Morganella morganii SC01]
MITGSGNGVQMNIAVYNPENDLRNNTVTNFLLNNLRPPA